MPNGKTYMIQDDEYIQTLTELGLTLLQARTYLALCKTGQVTAKTISKASNIARQNIYRILPTLEKLGLAQKIIANPTMYKATPIKEGYSLLLQNKTREHTRLQQRTIDLIKNSHESNDKPTLQEEVQQFVLISSKRLIEKKWEKEDTQTQKSLDIICDTPGFSAWMTNNSQIHKTTVKRGVKIRVITDKCRGSKLIDNISPIFKNNSLYEIRYITSLLPIKVAIYDGKKVSMYTERPRDFESVPNLFSTNPQFAEVISAYFEVLWSKATEYDAQTSH
jgi:sugar-specific transcriptional regulator TrmB